MRGLHIRILSGVCTTSGNYKSRNEDNFLLNKKILVGDKKYITKKDNSKQVGMFAVCDGMSGSKNGKEASFFITSYLARNRKTLLTSKLYSLKDMIRDLNNNLVKIHKDKMGSTLAMAVITEKEIQYINVGDSRIYIYSNGMLTKVSEEHNQANVLKRDNIYKKETKHILTQYIGIPETEILIEPNYGIYSYENDTEIMIMLCSDGVNDGLSDKAIEQLMKLNERKSPIHIAKTIVKEAIKGNSKDNITAMIIKIK